MTPLFPHVDESKLEALEARLQSLSQLNADFLMLLSCSTLIAALGLFQNSPAVVIGAMIIAPLMRPLTSLSLAALTADAKLLTRAIITLSIGTFTAIGLAFLTAQFFLSLELTDEILARTHPTLLDLAVAMAAGAVSAYCQSKENLADSLAGVAISVALVPPLSVVGIGLAYGNFSIWSGAFLLYATNLVGITAAGSVVFLILGFSPLHQARKGLLFSAVVSMIIVFPLGLSMKELIQENLVSAKVKSVLKEKTFTFRTLHLEKVQVQRFRTPMRVVATVLAPDQPITSNQVGLVQSFLEKEIGKTIEFKLRIIPTREVSAVELAGNRETPSELVPSQLRLLTSPSTINSSITGTAAVTSAKEVKETTQPTAP